MDVRGERLPVGDCVCCRDYRNERLCAKETDEGRLV